MNTESQFCARGHSSGPSLFLANCARKGLGPGDQGDGWHLEGATEMHVRKMLVMGATDLCSDQFQPQGL